MFISFGLDQFFSLLLSVNVNYMLAPPPKPDFLQTRYFLYAQALLIIVVGFIAGYIVPGVLSYFVASQYDEARRRIARARRQKRE